MSIISGTTIEYETKKHGEITSAYTYSPFFAAWNSYLLHDSSANTLCRWSSPTQTIRLQQSESVAYVDVLWIVNDPLDPRLSFYTKLVTDDADDTLQVITKLDIQKYKLVIDGYYYKTATESGTGTSETYKAAGEELPANSFITRYMTHWEAKNDPTDRTADTTPVIRYYDGTRYWYWKVPDMFNPQLCNDPRNNELFGDYLVSPYDNDLDVGYLRAPITAQNTWTYPPLRNSMLVGTSDDFAMIFDNPTEQRNVVSVNLTNIDAMLRSIACLGVYFEYDGVMYLGFMDESGQTTGEYLTAEDWSKSSQYNKDNINNYTEHNPPYVPPTPSGGDDFDGMVTGFTNNIGGSAKYWLLPSDPSGLFEDFFLHAPEGSSITQNILSCYVSALNIEWQTVAHKMVIYTNGSQKPAFESQATYNYIYQSNPHLVLGVFDVPRRTNTFYDFSPYTTYEVYVPFCGWIGLPDTVAGRKIRVYMDFDASICTCKARVECEANGGNVIVGEISGTFGSPCPIQVTEGGLYRQAAINSALQIASGVASGTLGAATKHGGPLAIGGFSYALQGLTNAATAGNTNYSQTIGRTGDSSNLAGTSHYCYLRITHPEIDEVVNNTRFGHTVGYLCNTIGRIGDFEGFTVCGNPHVTGIDCTESEKEEIKRMLEDGIIINSEEE